MTRFLLAFLLTICSLSEAQNVHAWVYFNDKPNVAASLSNPSTILTQRALSRKARHNIMLDSRDVPMNQSYVNQIKNATGIDYRTQSKWFNCVHVVGSTTDIDALENLPFVREVVYANPAFNRSSSNQDDKFANIITTPINYGSATNQIEMLGLDDLHDTGHTGDGVQIAVLDSGFPNVNTNPGFSQIRNNGGILSGYDFVAGDNQIYEDNFHGARVLSVMAGSFTGSFEGTAPDAEYYLYRTEDTASETPVEMSYWVAAAERADSLGVDVINTSLGYLDFDNTGESLSYNDMDGQTAFISQGANVAFEKGMLVVVSAGNSGNSSSHPWIAAPADASGSFTIGGVDANEIKSSFSSIGPTVDNRQKPNVVARASQTVTINESGNIVGSSGTSFSSPLIAGAAACLMQAFPNLTPQQIRSAIEASASQSNNPDNLLGFGIPDFGVAFTTLGGELVEPVLEDIIVSHNQDGVLIQSPAKTQIGNFDIYSTTGQLVMRKRSSSNRFQLANGTLKSGIYLIKFERTAKIFKIIMQ
jgi:hypothetical protein